MAGRLSTGSAWCRVQRRSAAPAGVGDDTYVNDRTVDTVISRLRRKLERDPHDPEMLLTAWGVGYKFRGLGLPEDGPPEGGHYADLKTRSS